MSEVARIEDEELEEQDGGFIILDDISAEEAVAHIKEAREKVELWDNFYKNRIKAMHEWAQRIEDYYTEQLRQYFLMVPHKEAKTQENYQLPSGKLVLKQQQPKYEPDDAELVPWLEQNMTELVKVKKSANWDGLKKLVEITPDGKGVMMKDGKEIVPGVKVTPQEPIFKVEIKY